MSGRVTLYKTAPVIDAAFVECMLLYGQPLQCQVLYILQPQLLNIAMVHYCSLYLRLFSMAWLSEKSYLFNMLMRYYTMY